jgi:hypothetical protein
MLALHSTLDPALRELFLEDLVDDAVLGAPRSACQRAMPSAVHFGIQIQPGPPYFEEGMCK